MSLGSLSKRRLWIGIAMIVAMVGSLAVACGDGDVSGAEATVQKMLDAMGAKDADAFVALMDPEGLQNLEAEGLGAEAYKQMIAQEMTYDSMEFTGVKMETELSEDGDSATVTIVEGKLITVAGGETTEKDVKEAEEPQVYKLVLRDGEWYLDISLGS